MMGSVNLWGVVFRKASVASVVVNMAMKFTDTIREGVPMIRTS